MLGGTLTATFLALSDARPDLATLSAVGASPRTRRGVAAAYALVVGAGRRALGAVVGFVPGLAIAYPLTYQAATLMSSAAPVQRPERGTGPFLDVPWLMVVGLVLGLPLLTAAGGRPGRPLPAPAGGPAGLRARAIKVRLDCLLLAGPCWPR